MQHPSGIEARRYFKRTTLARDAAKTKTDFVSPESGRARRCVGRVASASARAATQAADAAQRAQAEAERLRKAYADAAALAARLQDDAVALEIRAEADEHASRSCDAAYPERTARRW